MGSKVVCSLAYSWRPAGVHRLPLRGHKVNSRIWLRTVDDSTTNIILRIIIFIIIFIISSMCNRYDNRDKTTSAAMLLQRSNSMVISREPCAQSSRVIFFSRPDVSS